MFSFKLEERTSEVITILLHIINIFQLIYSKKAMKNNH